LGDILKKRNTRFIEILIVIALGAVSSLIAEIIVIIFKTYVQIYKWINMHEQAFQLFILISIFAVGVFLVVLTFFWLFKKNKNKILQKAIPVILLFCGVMLIFNSLHIVFIQPQQKDPSAPPEQIQPDPIVAPSPASPEHIRLDPAVDPSSVSPRSAALSFAGDTIEAQEWHSVTASLRDSIQTQELVVAVAEFTSNSDYSPNELSDITELFTGFLQEFGKVRVVTRSKWKEILGEHDFQRNGLVAKAEIKRLGVALGAQAIITGTLMKLGNTQILNLSLLDVESGEILAPARSTFTSLDEFIVLLPALATDIAKRLKKPSPLVGQWKVDNQPIILIFQEDGNFEIRDCKFVDGFEQIRRLVTPDGTGYQFEYRYYLGNVRGTYSHTVNEVSISGRFSGTIQTRQIWNDLSGEKIINTVNNGTNSFTTSFNYKSIDAQKLEINNCLFLRYYVSFTDNRWVGRYYMRLTKVE
jgi:TolB-like protein